MDGTKMAEAVLESVKGYLGRTLQPLLERLSALESRVPEKGEPGTSVTIDDVLPAVLPPLQEQLKAAIAALPVPQDGRTPTQEEVAAAAELPVARALLDFERRAQTILQRAIENIPAPKDGVDGMGFDDLTVEHDGERGFSIKLQRGERVKEFSFSVPVVIDRGFWKEGIRVSKGDGMTFGGSYWIAQTDTDTKPEIGNADWRLAVKKGRDGK